MNLCLTLAETSLPTLQEKIFRYQGQVAFIEVRFDYLSQPDIPGLPRESETRFVATCRPVREGGRYSGSERDRLQLLARAAVSGFSFLDLEHDVKQDPPYPDSVGIVRSCHRFGAFPDQLEDLFKKVKRREGEVTKLSLLVSSTGQLVKLLRFLENLPGTEPHTILGMGPFGQPSRLLGAFLGNCWTYVSEREEGAVAPGQFTLRRALDWYRLPSWTSAPCFYGVLGNPVEHSLSPALHNPLFAHYQLEKLYLPLQLDELEPWFDYLNTSRLAFHGFSVTLPFKTEARKFARLVRSPVPSINTLVKEGSWWEGLNTDHAGFLKPLLSRLSLKGATAVVVGNGGVAHTVVSALQSQGAQVTVLGRDPKRVEAFARHYHCDFGLLKDLPRRANLCVNTTPVGQSPEVDQSPLSERQLDFDWVYDLVYSPERTRLLQMAEKRGMGTISGMEMFVEQAALQFMAWTGVDPDREMMKQILR